MRFSLSLIPFVGFAVFFLVIAFRVIRFARSIRAAVSDGALGKSVHLDTPAGPVDIKPRQGRDPKLATLPLYPGAQPAQPEKPSYDVSFDLFGHGVQFTAENYWTQDGISVVREFYERNLPGWQWDRNIETGERLCHQEGNLVLAVTLRREGDRTMIEPSVSTKAAAASAIGPVVSSDSTYGVLR